eukprot:gene9389-biopygen45
MQRAVCIGAGRGALPRWYRACVMAHSTGKHVVAARASVQWPHGQACSGRTGKCVVPARASVEWPHWQAQAQSVGSQVRSI